MCMTIVKNIGLSSGFGTGKHNFGYVPDPPEPPDWKVPTDDIRKCEECEHLKTTRINGRDYTGCELWDCDKEEGK